MTDEEKRTGQGAAKAESPVVGDTTTRARNRTVMMTSELTGQVRARLGGEFQRPTPERSGGFVQESTREDDGWTSPEFDASSVTSTDFPADSGGEEHYEESPPLETPREERYSEAVSFQDGESTNNQAAPRLRAPLSERQSALQSSRPIEQPVSAAAADDDVYGYLKDDHGEPEAEASQERSTGPARIMKPKPLPRLAPLHAQEEPQEPAPQRPRPTREFKPMSQEEYLETFVVPPEPEQSEEVDSRDSITWTSESTLVGFLLSYDNNPKGDYVELRTGRLMVTCEFDASGNCLVVPHPSVSPMHAIMRVGTAGTIQVLDQLSENGTKIRHAGSVEEEFLSGEKGTLSHGDVVSFGERSFYVCLIKPPVE